MSTRYVPLLRWKAGEKVALGQLSGSAKVDVFPLILLGADNFKNKKATKKTAAVPADVAFAGEMLATWGTGAFYLDASPLPYATGAVHPLIGISAQISAAGGFLVPVIFLDAPPTYQQAVDAVVASDKHGVCLRISLAEMTAAGSWIGGWQYEPADTDLIVDLGDSAESVLALGGAVNAAFTALANGSQWRSVTLAGTSIPENFTGLASGVYPRPRSELLLWQQLRAAALPYGLDYGDYATVSTAAPPPGIAWGYPITVKYTLPAQFLICRGVRTTGMGGVEMADQLVGHAKSIAAYSARGALAACWADDRIDKIAAGLAKPQGLPFWVSLSVNRHIELVRATLT